MPVTWGSSPLARGPLGCDAGHAAAVGLIPARAGTTGRAGVGFVGVRAHPRSRGDHYALSFFAPATVGSSPLARGTHIPALSHIRVTGLIPARAGNT